MESVNNEFCYVWEDSEHFQGLLYTKGEQLLIDIDTP